ncbi:MAG: M24 family metallopeptidase [Chloroflexota bacterium]
MNHRLTELQRRLVEAGMDAAVLLHPRDVLYYAGTARPVSLLVVPQPGSATDQPPGVPPEAVLFVRRGLRYAREEATLERVQPMEGLSSVTRAVRELGVDEGVLGVELDVTPAQLTRRLEEAFAGWELVDASSLVLDQRAVKEEGEIEATRRAAAAADAGHRRLARVARAGMTELELVAEVERAMRLAGHEGYQPLRHPGARGGGMLLASGENLTVRGGHGLVVTGAGLSPGTPYGASRRRLRHGDLIVLDTGSCCAGYTGDESRTFVVGPSTEEQRALFGVTREAEEAALEAVGADVPIGEVYAAVEAVVSRGVEPFFGAGSLTLPGFVGHGIGLELDEPPVLWPGEEAPLRAGMVLAIEIEVSSRERGMMTKLEDTVVVRSGGYERLTDAPRDLIECG